MDHFFDNRKSMLFPGLRTLRRAYSPTMLRRLILPLLALAPLFAPAQTPTWDQLKAIYDVKPLNMDLVKTEDRQAAEGNYTTFSFPSEMGDNVSGVFVRPPGKGPFPLVVLIHGLGGNGQAMVDSFGKAFLSKGCAVVAIDAPHSGQRATADDKNMITGLFMRYAMSKNQSDGLGAFMFHDNAAANSKFAVETIEGGVKDLRQAIAWAKAPGHRVDPSKIGVMGMSMGSIEAAILSGVDPDINADLLIIGGDPIAPFLDQVPASDRLIDSGAACSLYLGHSTAHVMMLNGYNDNVMIRSDAQRLFESAPGTTLVFIDTPGDMGHGFGHSISAEGYSFGEEWLAKMIGVPKPEKRSHLEPSRGA